MEEEHLQPEWGVADSDRGWELSKQQTKRSAEVRPTAQTHIFPNW